MRFLTHPVVSSLLITLAMLGIILEMRTPGFGIPGIIGIGSLALFFGGHWLVQLAGWEELLLGFIGIVLLVLEVLVIPGFGIAGVLGIVAIVSSLVLSLVGPGFSTAFMLAAAGRVVFALLVAVLASLVLLRFLPRLPFGRRLVLERRAARRRRVMPRRPRATCSGWARAAAPHRRCGPPASPRSTASVSTWSPKASTSRPDSPSKSPAWTATALSCTRLTPQPQRGLRHE